MFAGDAALLGCCDVVIATPHASIGMGGPAMIEGGGQGVHEPDEIDQIDVQSPNGVVDVVAADETEAAAVGRRYLGVTSKAGSTGGSRPSRRPCALCANSGCGSTTSAVVETFTDTGSVLELRREFGAGMVIALIQVAGRSLGLIANNPTHFGGAIDADAADKAARCLQLCDGHGLPVLSLCATPGFMVGPTRNASRRAGTCRGCSSPAPI